MSDSFNPQDIIRIYCPNLLTDIMQIPDYMNISRQNFEVFKFRSRYYSPDFIKSCGYYISDFDSTALQYHFLLSNLVVQSSNMSFFNFFNCEAREYVSSLDQIKFSKSLKKLLKMKKSEKMIPCILPNENGIPVKSFLPIKDFLLVALRAKYYDLNSEYFMERYIAILCKLIVESYNYCEELKDYICNCKLGGILDRKVMYVIVNKVSE